jgi:ABC-type nitrate/sulfonate/bicarbonate transport system substrate-binding protein
MIAWLVLLQTTLTIAVSGPATNPEYWPLHLAEAEGYFAQEKLAVSLEANRADAGAAEALGRGRVDLAATSLDAALELGHVGGRPQSSSSADGDASGRSWCGGPEGQHPRSGRPHRKTIGVPAPGRRNSAS